jgi:hypothetical protein
MGVCAEEGVVVKSRAANEEGRRVSCFLFYPGTFSRSILAAEFDGAGNHV